MKNILIFISGFVAGVVYCLYRDVLSKPVEPVDDDLYDGLDIATAIKSMQGRYAATLDSLDDTQPVYIGDDNEVGVWELEEWAKESE